MFTFTNKNGKIVLDEIMMRQYSMAITMYSEESDKLSKLKVEFQELGKIQEIKQAREYVYKKFPKFKDHTAFEIMGVKYMIMDKKSNLRVLAWFTDEIICYDFI